MKKILSILLTALVLLTIAVSCAQDVTVDENVARSYTGDTFMVNGKYYGTFEEALKSIGSSKAIGDQDDVVYLLKNASGPGAVIDGMDVTIDFQGYTFDFTNVDALIDGTSDQTFGLKITGESNVNLKGMEKISLFDDTAKLTMIYIENSTVSLEDAPKLQVEDNQYVFWVADGATLTIGTTITTSKTNVSGGIKLEGASSVSVEESEVEIKDVVVEGTDALVSIDESATVTTTNVDNSKALNNLNTGSGTVAPEVVGHEHSSGTMKVKQIDGEWYNVTICGTCGAEMSKAALAFEGQARIDAVGYDTLASALSAARNGQTITLLKDISSFEGASVSKNITLNGNFHTLAGTGKGYASVSGQLVSQTNKALLVIESEADSFSVKNITINGTDKGIAVRNGVESLTITNSTINTSGNAYNSPIRLERKLSKTDTGYDTEVLTPILLTIDNSTLTSGSYYAVYTFLPLKTGSTISSSFISGYCALYFKPGCAGSVLSVSNSTLTGTNTSAGFSNGFATISFEDGGNNITLTNSILNAISSGNAQAMWAIQDSEWRWILKDITRSNEGNTVTVTGGHVNGDFYTNRNNLYYGLQDGYSYSASTITVTDKNSRTDIELDGTVQWDGNNVVMKSRDNLPLMSSIGADGKFCFDYYSVDDAPATYTQFYSFTEKDGWTRLTYEVQASIWKYSR